MTIAFIFVLFEDFTSCLFCALPQPANVSMAARMIDKRFILFLNLALFKYRTDLSTASERLNLNNPIQETDRFRSVGSVITLLFSVLKGRDIETIW